jgi:hypothetical protein
MQTMILLRLLPRWMQPIVAPLLPSYWKGRRIVQKAREVLYPKIQEILEARDRDTRDFSMESSTKEEEKDANILSWLAGNTKSSEWRNPASIAHVEILLSFASTHTSLTRIVNAMYDIMAADRSLAD